MITTLSIVFIFGGLTILFAKGYRINLKKDEPKIEARGILVINSNPKGAQVFINGELKTATDNTLSLASEAYDLSIKKEGFIEWKKRIKIEKEEVTQIDAFLVSTAPSLSAFTFSGILNPQYSIEAGKIGYIIPATDQDKSGLWVIETGNLPLGFGREPKRITDGDLKEATWQWSPDASQILLTTATGVFLIPSNTFTPQNQRINVLSRKAEILEEWKELEEKQIKAKISKLEDTIEDIILLGSEKIIFSPDEQKILYKSKTNAFLAEDLVKKLPGSSTQTEERNIKENNYYVYDIKEDKNFLIGEEEVVYWMPNSLNLFIAQKEGIEILDYDGQNKTKIFGNNYQYPFAFPTTNGNQILILTNLGDENSLANLYWLGIK